MVKFQSRRSLLMRAMEDYFSAPKAASIFVCRHGGADLFCIACTVWIPSECRQRQDQNLLAKSWPGRLTYVQYVRASFHPFFLSLNLKNFHAFCAPPTFFPRPWSLPKQRSTHAKNKGAHSTIWTRSPGAVPKLRSDLSITRFLNESCIFSQSQDKV